MSDFHTRTTCRLCHSTDLEKLLDFGQTCLANEYPREPKPDQDRFPLFLVGCRKCGHVQLPVVVDPKRLFPEDYAYQSGTSPVFRGHLAELAEEVACHIPLGGLLVEIASNDGTFLEQFDGVGCNVLGIDPAASGRMPYRREFFTEELANDPTLKGHASCVVALNCLAHVNDMSDVARGIKALLAPGGVLIFEVGYLLDIVRRRHFDVCYHEHLSQHHLTPLVPFFACHGMAVVDAQRIDSQGGSVRVTVRDGGDHQQSARLQALLAEEASADVWAGVRALSQSVESEQARLAEFATRHARAGKAIAVYGVPAKLTTYLAATQLPDGCIGLVVDDNPRKVGRYIPGTNLPIQSSAALTDYQPSGILCGSWNFAANIRERHAGLGAEWFVPFAVLTQ